MIDRWTSRWRGLVLVGIAVFVLILIPLCGCTTFTPVGTFSILPALVPSAASTQSGAVVVERPIVSVSGHGVDQVWWIISPHLQRCGFNAVRSHIVSPGVYHLEVDVVDDKWHDDYYNYGEKIVSAELFLARIGQSVLVGSNRSSGYYVLNSHDSRDHSYGRYMQRPASAYRSEYDALQAIADAAIKGICNASTSAAQIEIIPPPSDIQWNTGGVYLGTPGVYSPYYYYGGYHWRRGFSRGSGRHHKGQGKQNTHNGSRSPPKKGR